MQAANFYIREHPLLLNDLLIELSGKLDHARMVNNVKQLGHLPLIQKYLLYVQRENIPLLNEVRCAGRPVVQTSAIE